MVLRLQKKLIVVLAGFAFLAGCASVPKESRDEAFRAPLSDMTLSSGFGMRRGKPHNGLDIPAPKGTDIAATASGHVIYAGKQRGFGKIVILQHPAGFQSFYAHLSRISVNEGRAVKQGQTIGKVGKTGNASGPHLHFEIRYQAMPIDPRTVLGRTINEFTAD